MALIDDYITRLANVQRLYEANWVLAYGSAYAIAFENFNRTIASQQAFDKLKADLFVMALTMGAGAGLGALMGKATLSSVVVDQAVRVVCNRNMTRTFNVIAAVAGNPAGAFIAKSAWTEISTMLTRAVKSQVENLVSSVPGARRSISNPQVVQNDLRAYLLRAIAAAHSVAEHVRDNNIMSAEGRDSYAREMMEASLIQNAPTADVTGRREDVVKDLELSLYMVMVMHSDYVNTLTSVQTGLTSDSTDITRRPITQSASAQNYPRAAAPIREMGYTRLEAVVYDAPGSRIMDRIEELYSERVGGSFVHGSYGRDEVRRAEAASTRLQQRYLNML